MNFIWFAFSFFVPTITTLISVEETDSMWVGAVVFIVSVMVVLGCAVLFYAKTA